MSSKPDHPELLRLARQFNWILPSLDDCPPTESAYSDEHARERAELDRFSWWYQTRNCIIRKALRPIPRNHALWDIGCGTGVVAESLIDDGREVIGLEPSAVGAVIASSYGLTILPTTLESLHLPNESIQTIMLFDVLEHIADRQDFLREIQRVLTPGGYLLISVPAMNWLWSSFDIDERHHLRYTKKKLSSELSSNGFRVTKTGYYFFLTVIPLFMLRALPFRFGLRSQLTDRSAVGASGGVLGRILTRIETLIALQVPLGSSLFAIAQRE